MDLIGLAIKLACREPGCPVCWLRLRDERRYLFNFLWENVNDPGTRQRLIRSLGFCHDHAWQLQDMEATIWHDGMGTAIVYEDLANRTSRQLGTYRRRLPSPSGSPSRRERLRAWAAEVRRLSVLWRADGESERIPAQAQLPVSG